MIDEGVSQFVVFRIGDNDFAVPVEQVQEILVFGTIAQVPKTPAFVQGILNVRGRIIPVLDLAARLDLPARPVGPETRIVVVEVSGQTIGMIVDMVTEVVKVPSSAIKPPPPLISTVAPHFVTGVANLDARILVILDLERVLNFEEVGAMSAAAATVSEA